MSSSWRQQRPRPGFQQWQWQRSAPAGAAAAGRRGPRSTSMWGTLRSRAPPARLDPDNFERSTHLRSVRDWLHRSAVVLYCATAAPPAALPGGPAEDGEEEEPPTLFFEQAEQRQAGGVRRAEAAAAALGPMFPASAQQREQRERHITEQRERREQRQLTQRMQWRSAAAAAGVDGRLDGVVPGLVLRTRGDLDLEWRYSVRGVRGVGAGGSADRRRWTMEVVRHEEAGDVAVRVRLDVLLRTRTVEWTVDEPAVDELHGGGVTHASASASAEEAREAATTARLTLFDDLEDALA